MTKNHYECSMIFGGQNDFGRRNILQGWLKGERDEHDQIVDETAIVDAQWNKGFQWSKEEKMYRGKP